MQIDSQYTSEGCKKAPCRSVASDSNMAARRVFKNTRINRNLEFVECELRCSFINKMHWSHPNT